MQDCERTRAWHCILGGICIDVHRSGGELEKFSCVSQVGVLLDCWLIRGDVAEAAETIECVNGQLRKLGADRAGGERS